MSFGDDTLDPSNDWHVCPTCAHLWHDPSLGPCPNSGCGCLRKAPDPSERVDHPAHYGGDVPHEHVKCATAWGLVENAFLYLCTKYICRVGRKAGTDPLEDLRKARWYLDRAIEQLEQK